jgi:transposase InsO family protein
MDERLRMISDWLTGVYSITELSQFYGVSRKTVYKWTQRYQQKGSAGLQEHSRAPHQHPNQTATEIIERIIAAKLQHQNWGPEKLIARLSQDDPTTPWPAPSTAGLWLKRNGLVRSRRYRRRTPADPQTPTMGQCPNAVWSADFKGQFQTQDGKYCYPLTITDHHSRYVLACRALSAPSYAASRPWFEWVFRQYGLPQVIRTDNGAPFASVAVGGLSPLSIWWIKLGIRPERIQPGHPEQNGRHERMHRTLKAETARPPAANLKAQQAAFDRFVDEFNRERPHATLGQRPPATLYQPSSQPYPMRVPQVHYVDDEVHIRRVRHNGEIKWQGQHIYISCNLAGEPVALKQQAEHLWELSFSFHVLGTLDERRGKILRPSSWGGRKL